MADVDCSHAREKSSPTGAKGQISVGAGRGIWTRRDRARARRQTRGAFGEAGDRHRTIQGEAGGGETATPAGEEAAASDRSQAESHAIAGGAPSPGGRGHGGGGGC